MVISGGGGTQLVVVCMVVTSSGLNVLATSMLSPHSCEGLP